MQMVEIAKALRRNARILIMDEPSAVLTPFELAKLFEIIRGARARGVGVIYISHRLEEIFEIGDRTTVLKDGAKVSTVNVADVDKWQIVKMMVGRDLGKNYPKRHHQIGEPVLEVTNVTRRGRLENVSFRLHRGEILGVAGLIGAGRSDLAQVIFGAQSADSGEIRINGELTRIRSPKDAMRRRMGFLTEDRRQTGLFSWLTVRENISITNLQRITRGILLDLKRELQVVLALVKQLRVATPSVEQKVENLSGGNQQRVVLAKWINTDSTIFLIDEPTRGIDVGSKEDFYFLMNDLTSKGAAILMISSELPEILGMSDRILVMNKGRITAELPAAEATEEKIMQYAALEVSR
jgi:ribose transport system ATP-binding protein